MHEEQWPSPLYRKLEMYTPNWTPRSSSEHKLRAPLEDNTFQASCAKVYNDLHQEIILCDNINMFNCLAKTLFRGQSGRTTLCLNYFLINVFALI